jgi:hypothetical protein
MTAVSIPAPPMPKIRALFARRHPISPKFAMGDQRVTSYPVAVRQGESVGKRAVVYEIALLAPRADAISRRIGLPRGKHWALL